MKTKRTPNPYEFAGFDDWIEVFQAGTQTDAHGQTKTFSQSDLDSMVVNHQPVPIVIGHPKMNDPAFGWSQELKREGDSLYAKFTDVEPQFAKLVEQRRYPERSIRIATADNGYQLKHVGFLGAVAPAVQGMKPIEFSGDDEGSLEFSGEWRVTGSVNRIFRRFKNFLIQDKGEEVAEQIFPEFELDSLTEQSVSQRLEEYKDDSAFSQSNQTNQPTGDKTVGDYTQAQLDDAVAKATATAEKQAREEVENDYSSKLANVELKQRKADALRRVDALLEEQKLIPAQTQGLAEFMAALDNSNEATFEFSVGEGDKAKTQKKSPSQFFNAFLDNLPKHGLFNKADGQDWQGEPEQQDFTAPDGSLIDAEGLELDKKARDYMQKNQGVSYIDAAAAVQRGE